MADNSTSSIYTNTPNKGLVLDLNSNYVGKDLWSYLRNGVNNTHLGDIPTVSNEPSNYKCVDIPYTPIGFVRILDDRWIIWSTDNVNSEIGIFHEKLCTYDKLVNDSCLNLSLDHPIQAVFKKNHDCTETVYFTDAFNNRRKLNIQNVPYKYTIGTDSCDSKIFNNELDCDSLLMNTSMTLPCIQARISVSGNLLNGVYQFAIAYSINKVRISDYYSISSPLRVWSHENRGYAIDLTITNLDRDYDEYELAAIYTVNNVPHYKSLGFYSTSNNTQHISSVERNEFTEINLLELIAKYPRYSNADLVVANDQYLLWAGVSTTPEINYQLDAMNIQSEYIVYEVPQNYYANGGILVGYCRDETYSFGIQWLLPNGEWSSVYHIPGRTGSETGFASGGNVYESKSSSCDPDLPKNFQVNNTGGDIIPEKDPATCNERIIGTGKMAYFESTDLYPDNKILFGKYSCTPIRHHKFPSNCNTHIYGNSGDTINILGIRFKNITTPKDSNGNDINVVGYRIVRGTRQGNRSVIAKGIATNIRSYIDEDEKTILYPNYPYNDLRSDNFLSTKLPYRKGSSEKDFKPLTGVETDKFSFYSPHTLFTNIGLGTEINFLTEEIAVTEGNFILPWKHPGQKLVTEFDLYFALIIGAIDGFLSTRGKRCVVTYVNPTRAVEESIPGILNLQKPRIMTTTGSTATGTLAIDGTTELIAGDVFVTGGTTLKQLTSYQKAEADYDGLAQEQYCNDIISQLQGAIQTAGTAQKVIAKGLKILASVGIFSYFALKTAQETLDTLYNFSPWENYALQYNSKAFFNDFKCFDKSNNRKGIDYYQYVYDGLNTVESFNLNNYKRANSVYIRTSDDVTFPKTKDTSRNTISDLKMCSNIFAKITQPASVYYTSIKIKIPNQYGQVDSIEYIDTGNCIKDLVKDKNGFYVTDPIFGGDTFINKFAIKDTFEYFSQYLYDVPDGYIFDYSNYRNVAYPRFWMSSAPYDLSEIVNIKPKKSNLPKNKYNLDCNGNSTFSLSSITTIKDSYFYIHNSSVKEFFVESDFNLDYRDWTTDKPTFYSRFNQDLNTLFKSGEDIEKREEFLYDQTYSKQLLENSIEAQRIDFDPTIDETCYQYIPNRVIYSLPASQEQKGDNWQVNLANNYYDFPSADFGNITSMQSIDNQQIMFLFDKSAPYVTIGRDELQLDGSGKKITLGDGGLFSREPRPIAFTDYGYGNSQSKYAFVNTQFGSFYPSQRQGRLFNFTGKMEEISRNGVHYWFKQYSPSKLLKQFPDFINKDNPVNGVSMVSVFDNNDERYYLTKRDYSLKSDFIANTTYNSTNNTFTYNNKIISLKDTTYFNDSSWTISYSPKDQSFISFHDWHPDWTMQSEEHFMTIKNNSIWKHNDNYNSFCNFYGIQYPFSIEYIINNGQNVDVLRSIEYYIEAGKYSNNGKDFTNILDENFDSLIVSNSEQISGFLKLNLQKKNSFADSFLYPKISSTNNTIDVLFSKEEQKIRVNTFWDIIKDRGEFSTFNYPLWITEDNGYIKDINPDAVDYNKKDWQRKKFRNTWHKILLTKEYSQDKKIITKFLDSKLNYSFR